MREHVFTALCAFCGLGGGGRGLTQARAALFGNEARFRVLGGFDIDPAACRDFELLTGAPGWCTDVRDITAAELRRRYGDLAPDVVLITAPCKGASALLSKEKARTKKYRDLNRLALRWAEVMLDAWGAEPPRVVLFENVPRIKQRAGGMVRRLRKLLRAAGYVFTDGYHDCGELGGLAQVRRRWLMVARHPGRCAPLLYQPPKRRVRGCGEVLSQLPIPLDGAGGPMHRMPRLSWVNWVRLALIPAGGDYRDLDGVLKDGQTKREVFKRHAVQRWKDPSGTVAGSGSNGPGAVADPRLPLCDCGHSAADHGVGLGDHWNKMRVEDWYKPAHTVTGTDRIGSGAPSIADPRAKERFGNVLTVNPWDEPAAAVTSGTGPTNGGQSVADPRVPSFGGGREGVLDWGGPAGTVTGESYPSNGRNSVADPRAIELLLPKRPAYDHAYGVLRADEPSPTVAGGSAVGQGAYAVADDRIRSFGGGREGVLEWTEPAGTITGNARPSTGRFSVADLRIKCKPRDGAYGVLSWEEAAGAITGHAKIDNGRFAVADPRKPPDFTPIIIAADGTWHRPLTTLELAALQDLPTEIDGKPLVLDGSSVSAWRERIGNALPPGTAREIGVRVLVALLQHVLEAFALSSGDLDVWVREPNQECPA